MPLLNHVQQVLLRETHRDVLDHHGRESLDAVKDGMEVDHVVYEFCDLIYLWSRRLLHLLSRCLMRLVVHRRGYEVHTIVA